MSGMGEALSDFIKALYYAIGCLTVAVVVLLGVIIWMVVR